MSYKDLADLAAVIDQTKTIIATANWSVVPKDKMNELRKVLKELEANFVTRLLRSYINEPSWRYEEVKKALDEKFETPLTALNDAGMVLMVAPGEKVEPKEEEVKQVDVDKVSKTAKAMKAKPKCSFKRVDDSE